MKTTILGKTPPPWLTSSLSDSPDWSPAELTALGSHMQDCNKGRERLFALNYFGDAIETFLAPRFVSILVVFALLSAFVAFMT